MCLSIYIVFIFVYTHIVAGQHAGSVNGKSSSVLTGWSLIGHQFKALFIKRFHHARRSRRGIIAQVKSHNLISTCHHSHCPLDNSVILSFIYRKYCSNVSLVCTKLLFCSWALLLFQLWTGHVIVINQPQAEKLFTHYSNGWDLVLFISREGWTFIEITKCEHTEGELSLGGVVWGVGRQKLRLSG